MNLKYKMKRFKQIKCITGKGIKTFPDCPKEVNHKGAPCVWKVSTEPLIYNKRCPLYEFPKETKKHRKKEKSKYNIG